MTKWTIDDARDIYNIGGWGADYFDINDKGHIIVRPDKNSKQVIDLKL